MRINVIYLTYSISASIREYERGRILQNYPISKFKVWFVDKLEAEKAQAKLLIRAQTVLVKKASA